MAKSREHKLYGLPSLKQTGNKQYHNGPDATCNDQVYHVASNTDVNAQFSEQPAAHKGACDAQNNVPQQAEAAAFPNEAREPARHRADDEDVKKIHTELIYGQTALLQRNSLPARLVINNSMATKIVILF